MKIWNFDVWKSASEGFALGYSTILFHNSWSDFELPIETVAQILQESIGYNFSIFNRKKKSEQIKNLEIAEIWNFQNFIENVEIFKFSKKYELDEKTPSGNRVYLEIVLLKYIFFIV